jgi:hypothetical protein
VRDEVLGDELEADALEDGEGEGELGDEGGAVAAGGAEAVGGLGFTAVAGAEALGAHLVAPAEAEAHLVDGTSIELGLGADHGGEGGLALVAEGDLLEALELEGGGEAEAAPVLEPACADLVAAAEGEVEDGGGRGVVDEIEGGFAEEARSRSRSRAKVSS